MNLHHQDNTTKVIHGDCIETMNQMEPETISAIVTDPPYGLGFMGKKWDNLPPSKEWAEACYRVLKPGGHIVAFGGTRTWHRLAVAIEDAGFEMRDSLAWLYGSGFPKSHDVGKAIDKLDASDERRARALEFTTFIRESGLTARRIDELTGTNMGGHFTTAASQPAIATADLFDRLRPHLHEVPERIEELVRLRTVESENFASRKVVGSRVTGAAMGRGSSGVDLGTGGTDFGSGQNVIDITAPSTPEAEKWDGWGTALKPAFEPIVLARKPFPGTVARNVLEHGTGAINVDACRVSTNDDTARPNGVTAIWQEGGTAKSGIGGGSPAGRWPANVLLDQHAAGWVDEQSGVSVSRARNKGLQTSGQHGGLAGDEMNLKPGTDYVRGHSDSGGASRFFYTAKAPKRERPNVNGIQHPTVKPLSIMEWLIRLVTPPGGTVLDPFAGSGTTLEAARKAGFSSIGIEAEETYLPLIDQRLQRSNTNPTEL